MATPPIRAAYWISLDSFPASSVQTSLFSHVYYASVQPDPESFYLTITQTERTKLHKFIKSIGSIQPPVKTLLSIGGADSDKQVFSNMASTQQNRQAFITSTIEVARTYGFDGVDLDWEFPDNEVDMLNLGLLYERWRNALEEDAEARKKPCLLLTSAVYYALAVDIDGPQRRYPAVAIKNYVDWVNLMCYDYHGPWDKVTDVPAALNDPYSSTKNTKYGITSWIGADVQQHKLVMGLPLYGRSWKLQNLGNNGIRAPAEGMPGKPSYKAIVALNKANDVEATFDEPTASYYSCSGSTWTGFDGVLSVQKKVQYAKSLGLGGYFFWALGKDTDDWTLSREAFDAWNK